jgi:hypothetical protein
MSLEPPAWVTSAVDVPPNEDACNRKGRPVKVERTRENIFTVIATSQELSALVAASRMALDAMLDDPHAPAEAIRLLERVLADYDAAIRRDE